MSRTEAAPSRSRVALTFGAQIYNQSITVGVQLALVPVLLHFWGTERYGVWILLSAVPTYLTFADLGFTMAAKNVMTIKVAEGNRTGALATYQSIFMLLNFVIGAVLLLLLGTFPFLKISSVFTLDSTGDAPAKSVLILLAVNVLLTQYQLLFASGLRCAGRPAEEVIWGASARLMEGVVTGIAAILGDSLVAAALAIVVNRMAFLLLVWLRLRLAEPWLPLGYQHASFAEAKKLFHPSLSFMLVSIAQALTIQGPVVVLGLTGTPTEVVIFSTSRTLARLGTSAANIFNFALTPEYSRLFGLGKLEQFVRLIQIHFWTSVAASVAYVAVLGIAANEILAIWTRGAVSVQNPFFAVLLLAVAAEMIWSTELIPLASINKHIAVSRVFAGTGLVAIALSYAAGRYFGGLTWITAPLLGMHCVLVAFAGSQLWIFLADTRKQFRAHEA
jgi:O-antigen/teichoic acid export membrane protein